MTVYNNKTYCDNYALKFTFPCNKNDNKLS